MRYTWLILDADNTLFDYDLAEATALERAFISAGYAYGADYLDAYRRINAGIWREFEEGTITQDRLKAERFRRLFRELKSDADPEAFSASYLGHLAQGAFLLPEAEEVVKALCGKIGLLLMTNGLADVQRPRLAASPIAACFDGIVVSEEVGASKPDPQIFHMAFTLMGDPPKAEVLMVGDSLTSDMRGGIDYGIDTCWFNPAGKPRPDGVQVTYEIRALRELLKIVGADPARGRLLRS